jgi:hypothetical protein
MSKIEKLKELFSAYEGSEMFIDCVQYALTKAGQKENQIVWFVNNHFRTNTECDIITMKKCAVNWNNISWDKLNQFDFINYKQTVYTLSAYRMIIKSMEIYQQ